MTNLKDRISAAAGRIETTLSKAVTKGTKKAGAVKVTGFNSELVSTEFGVFFKSPATERYFATKAMLDRLSNAFNGYDSGAIDRPTLIAEIRAVASLHDPSDTRAERMRVLADVMERSESSLALMAGVQADLKTRLVGLSGTLVIEAVRAPDGHTIAAPEPKDPKDRKRPEDARVYEYNPDAGTARDLKGYGGR
ncbi:hypothetical protein QTH90_06245 [Variovorax sp. J2P1-59]|uniref:hypothetical protein n=1 Tax=Variovorax flavidus TaxID=3053501 RepID=UPI002577172B|nr:hypothetical protein [Variovorax sp. J2P1-59]MDM0073974.1 hypothetical protein [Variovorax sp. J2P1-59]